MTREEQIVGVIAEVLSRPQIGREDDFFALEGSSPPARRQLAEKLASRLREILGVKIPLPALLAHPTAAGLAAWIGSARLGASVPPIERAASHWEPPLSYGQQRLWFLAQLKPGVTAYNVPIVLELAGPLDASALQRSLHAIERRHESLRTTFRVREGQPFQSVAACEDAPLPVIDLSRLPRERCERVAAELAAEEHRQPFDLEAGPLWRSRLLRLDSRRHRLVQTLHHIICDGWSIELLLREIGQHYGAFTSGCTEPELPVLPIQYVDYAFWQHRFFNREALSGSLEAWKRRLAGYLSVLELAVDPTPPELRSTAGASVAIELPIPLLEATRMQSRLQGVTQFMALLAVFEILLSRYTGRCELLVGTPVANRSRAELTALIGFFANTLALPARISPAASFRELLTHVREVMVAAFQHQELPLQMLVQELAPERSDHRRPFLQAMFAYHGAPTALPAMPGLALRLLGSASSEAMFDLSLTVVEMQGRLRVLLEYSTALLSRTAASRLLGHFATLLEGAVTNPEQRIEELPLLTEAERHQLLVSWNDTGRHALEGSCLHHLFEAQVQRTPRALAVACRETHITYAELSLRSRRLADHLRSLGVGAEVLVGICLERDLDLVIALLAVLKAGGAYLPIDPSYPSERLALILEDSAPRVLITRPHLLPTLPDTPGTILCLEDKPAHGVPVDSSGGAPVAEDDDRQLAYVLYTSGSTGRPKGVGVSHRALVNFLASMRRAPGFAPGDRLLAVTSLAFDIAALEIFLPLVTGGCVELASREEASDGALLADRLRASGVNVLQGTPATWRMLLDAGWTGDPDFRALCGGEALPRGLAATLTGCVRELWNLYGPTETTVWSAMARIRPDETSPISIGRPVAATQIHLLDRQLQTVPPGLHGELWIGGAGLARGYLGRPDLTAELFLPDPWSAAPGDRIYRTGDLARHLPGGRMEVLGRIDHQVKLRGFRIEPGEIEAALAKHPGVREAAVALCGGSLVAYLVPREEIPAAAALRDFLRRSLPEPMIPAFFVPLAALPLTPNRKVDRKALPTPEPLGTGEGHRAPRNPVEELLAGVFAEVLGRNRVGIDDDFFALGGHSLLATRVVSRLRSVFGVELPLRTLFERPRVAELAPAVAEARRDGGGPSAPPLVPVPREGDLPLSFAQERLWFLDQLVAGNPFYNMTATVRFHGSLDTAVLAASLAEIVRRHESLRTTFRVRQGHPRQEIAPPPPPGLPRIDLAGLPAAARTAEAHRLAAEEALRPFDLAHPPLFRALLVRLDPEEHTLLISLHHVIADGWSGSILHHELVALYGAFTAGAPTPLPKLPVQYADFAVWQRQWLQGDVLRAQLDYWKSQLADLPGLLDLPSDYPRPAVEKFRGATASARLPALLVRDLGVLARRCGATLSMSVLAGFSTLLARIARRDDLPVGMTIANRTRREIEGLIGFFVNTLVIRNRIPLGTGEKAGFDGFLRSVRETALDAFTYQDLPFEKLVEELQPERDLGHNPLVQVMFSWQSFPRSQARIQGLTLAPLENGGGSTGTSKFDLTLFLQEQEGEILAILEYNRDLFEAVTVKRLLGHLETLLTTAVAVPESPIAEVSLISAPERQQLVREWNVGASFPAEENLAELFEAQVRRAPDAPALKFEGRLLSYAELNRRANRLAHSLRGLGVGPEICVGLCVGRSPELAVGILGIFKAGGAYLPLDPDYPRERLAFLIEDSRPRVLVAEKYSLEALPDLQAGGPKVVLLDSHQEALKTYPADDPPPLAGGNEIAYVIYTSGSTGHPKGVLVTHAAVVRLLRATEPLFSFGTSDIWTLFHSYAFDFSVWELWGALAYGGCLVVVPYEISRSPEEFCDLLERDRVTVLNQTPSAFRQLVTADTVRPRDLALRWVIFGGEALDPRSLAPWISRRGDQRPRLVNMYGITETTVHVTWRPLAGRYTVAYGSPIGRPIADLEAHVLDGFGQPTSIGVPGEIFVAGAGLARGYLNRSALTAERFLPDPFSGQPGARLYRTGDLARRLPDGELEHLGRIDHQVKVRGFRIELEEIEAVLREYSAVRDAVVLVRGSSMEDQRLVAYVVVELEQVIGGDCTGDEQVSQWAMIFDDTYRKDARETNSTFNITGWESTYTGEPIPRDEMAEWLEDTVERLRTISLGRVLEIGCGTGLLLFRIAPESKAYVGTDLSHEAIEYVQRHLGLLADPGKVRLLTRPATRFEGFAPDSFDTLLLNSVAQYFPSLDYFLEVLIGAVEVVRPGGVIFLGDLRSLPLLEAFHTSVELFQAEPDLPLALLRQRVQLRRQLENELVVSPVLFAALQQRLPKIGRVEIHPKRGHAHNELTSFRYQVMLHLGETPPAEKIPWLDWRRDGLTLEVVRSRLEEKTSGALAVRDVPNARVAAAAEAVQLMREGKAITTAELRQSAALAAARAVDPQALWDLGRELGWEVDLGWASHGSSGSFDAILRRHDQSRKQAPLASLLPSALPGSVSRSLSSYSNHPMQGRFARRMAPELRAFLSSRLPDYMVPAAFVLLDQLPLTTHGKVDRQRLPEPEISRQGDSVSYVPPRTTTEKWLAAIYAELLGIDRVGADDNFFVLGGHSLLATQVLSRVRSELAIELPLRTIFEQPTVAGFAAAVDALDDRPTEPQAPPILPGPRSSEIAIPLSFAQKRLWFFDQLDPEKGSFNIAATIRLEGLLDTRALEAALYEIERRHEILRTTFPTQTDVPVQVVSPLPALRLPHVDLSGLPASRRETEFGLLAWAEARLPFDLALGPVWRTALVCLEATDHALLLTLHHITSDAWSLSILVQEVGVLYAAFSQGLPSPLPDLPIQFADYAAWQRCWLDGEARAPEVAYWRKRLAGAPVVILPTELSHRPEQPIKPAYLPVVVEPELASELATLARAASATMFMAVLSVFQAVLALHTGRYDIVTGSNVSNRNRLETEGLIGCFLNILVLRTDLSGDPTFEELLQRIREVTLGAFAHQNLPFDSLVQELEPSRAVARTPLFQVKVDLLPAAPPAELSALCLRVLDTGRIVVRYDLHLSLQEENGRLRGKLLYDAGRFTTTTVDQLRTRFGRLLAEAVRTPVARLSELGQRLEAAEVAERQERRQALGRANLASLRQIRRRPLPEATPNLSVETDT